MVFIRGNIINNKKSINYIMQIKDSYSHLLRSFGFHGFLKDIKCTVQKVQ